MTILVFIFVLGTMIIIHEFGHFAVAKLLKIRVETFSVGFGPRLFGFRRGDTDYRVSIIPLGGYVKMKGENVDEQLTGAPDEFLSRPKWQRFSVAIAGPGLNILTALIIPAVAAMISFQVPAYVVQPVVVGSVVPGSPAAQLGLQPGDRIVDFRGVRDPLWQDVELKITANPNQQIPIVVERNGTRLSMTLVPAGHRADGEIIGDAGIIPEFPKDYVEVNAVTEGSPAQAAGLRRGDKIVTFNGHEVPNFPWLSSAIQYNGERPATLTILRDGQKLELTTTPRIDPDGKARIGFSPVWRNIPMQKSRKSLIEAIKYSVAKNYELIVITKDVFAQILARERSVRDSLAGPIGIAKVSGQAAERGWESLFALMGFLSLNLGIFNLLPIPVLDGGVIFMLLIEAVLGLFGLPFTMALREKMNQVGLVILLLIMGFVIYNDVSKYILPSDQSPPQTQQIQPANK